MKQKLLTISFILFLILLGSCSKNKEYTDGETVTIDGIVYEFDTSENIPYYDINNPTNAIYHKFYYLDMLDKSQTVLPDTEDYFKAYQSNFTYSLAKEENNVLNSYQRIISPSTYFNKNENGAFFVKSYTSKHKNDVTISDSINGYPVIGIGYNSFAGIELTSLKSDSNNELVIMPYAFKDANIKTIELNSRKKTILPMAFDSAAIDNLSFDSSILALDLAFYQSEINTLEFASLLNYESLWGYTGGVGIKYSPFHMASINKVNTITNNGVSIIGSNYYFSTYDRYYEMLPLITNENDKTLYISLQNEFIVKFIQDNNFYSTFDIQNNKINHYVFTNENLSKYENIIIKCEDYQKEDSNYFVLENKTLYFMVEGIKIEVLSAPNSVNLCVIGL